MQGPIAQIIALTLYGNAVIHGHNPEIDKFFPSNSTFTFCEYVKFVDVSEINGTVEEKPFSNNPQDWFEKLKTEGVFAFRLIYGPSENKDFSDRMTIGLIGGGGRWLIETISPTGSDFWEARWEVGNKNHPKKLIWQVTYGRIAKKQKTFEHRARTNPQVKSDLSITLKAIAEFARKHDLENFENAFDKGYAALYSENPFSEVYHKDISPKDFLVLEANQLLATSQAAWVFGGMGSWNDMGFDGRDQKEYEKLSDDLYNLQNESYLVAVNSSAVISSDIFSKTDKPWWQFWK
jgi:hypothetical protein